MQQRHFNDQELTKREKLNRLKVQKQDPFLVTKFIRNFNTLSFHQKFDGFEKNALSTDQTHITIAGRVMALRQTFGILQDMYGRVQFYVNKKNINPEIFTKFKNDIDIGDIVGIQGTPMKTNTGELTINVKDIVLLTKTLKPLPEKWHGLQNEELRSRKRYLDLIMNQDSFRVFMLRSLVIKEIRNYMNGIGYLEVETPILNASLGGANARPFVTHHNTLDREYYLRIATELPLKKLVVGGFEKIYEIGRIFRNEGMDATHNPEFTTIEGYEAYASMWEMMDLIETLFRTIGNKLAKTTLTFKDIKIDLNQKFQRVSMTQLIKQQTNVDFDIITSDEQAISLAKEHDIKLKLHQKNIGHVMLLFFEKYCEKQIANPTFVYYYPIEVSPLAKKYPQNPRLTERFELYICGKEFANAFSELNDPIEQYERFKNQLIEKAKGNDEANEMDMDYIEALEYGLAPTGGFGIGIDRMVMLFADQQTIRNVLLFPHLREEK